MPTLHQFDYLFAIGTIFAALDAFNIGANDVANSFATSVSSRSLTMRQAMLCAAVCEFGGAVLVGARVADTIKNGIIPLPIFQNNAGVQILAFTCALVASSSWLMFCTRYSFTVSTTYSIVSALAGVGIAVGGINAPNWGWNNGKGLATIFAGFGIAPGIAACFGAAVYLLVKLVVLVRKEPVKWGLYTSPFFFFLVAAVLTMSIVYKGSPSLGLDKLPQGKIAMIIVVTAAVVSFLSAMFWWPWVRQVVIKKDYTMKWYHIFMGPLLWTRAPPADAAEISATASAVPDYRIRDRDDEVIATPVLAESRRESDSGSNDDIEKIAPTSPSAAAVNSQLKETIEKKDAIPGGPIDGPWILPRNLWIIIRHRIPYVLSYGAMYDIHAAQMGQAGTVDGERMRKIYAAARQYPNEVEHVYSFMQVLTACTASFAHGANDVSNAIGPYAAIYQVWSSGVVNGSKADIPVWILVFGGAMISIGLVTFGYNIMKILGNRITLHSPSRGMSMELGAAITVILATNYGLPVSTTMCITGATIGVALCNRDLKSINWRTLGWIFLGWVLTVPIVGIVAYCLCSIILRAPHF